MKAGMLRRAGCAAAITVAALLSAASPATAAPSPAATGPAPAPSASTPATAPSTPPPAQPSQPAQERPTSDGGKGVLGPLNVTDPDGVPIDHYDITYSTGGFMGSESFSALLGWINDGLFSLVKLIIGAVAWLLNWGFSFGPANDGLAPVRNITQAYQTQVIDRLGLKTFFLMVAAAWCGFMFLRGRKSRGLTELLISLLIAALAATLLARPGDLLLGSGGLLGQTRNTAMSLASITATGGKSDTSDPGQASKPLTDTLVKTFVVEPHQMLNYGQILDDPKHPSRCLATYRQIVKDGPWGTSDDPRDRMTAAGCGDLASYNKHPSWDRLLGTLLVLVAALLVAVLILLMVGVLLTAIAALAFYAMLAQAVAVIAVLPGGGRGVLWRWVGGITKVVLVIVAVVVFIPLLSLFIGALIKSSSGQPLVARFFLVDVVVAAGLLYHRKLVHFGTRAGYRISRRLEMSRYGGSRGGGWGQDGMGGYGMGGYGMGMGWMGSGSPGSLSPVTAGGIWRGAQAEIQRITGPVTASTQGAKRRFVGPGTATAKANAKLTAQGVDKDSLRHRMYQTRGGRVAWRAGKTITAAGKTAFSYSVGLPVTLEDDYKTTRQAGKEGWKKTKDAAQSAKTTAAQGGAAARTYGKRWAHNTGLEWATRGPRGAARDQYDTARLSSSIDPETARRYADSRARNTHQTHQTGQPQHTSPSPAVPTTADHAKAAAASAAKHTAKSATAGAVTGAIKGFLVGGPDGAAAGAVKGATQRAQKGVQKGTDPQQRAQELRRRMEQRRTNAPPDPKPPPTDPGSNP